MRVLVIDDSAVLRAMAQGILGDKHEVVVAASGIEGLRVVASGAFDVVVCDMQIGDMTGLEVWERLPDHLRTRFLLWTGAPELAEGVDIRVLTKPTGMRDLLVAVEGVYKG